jgi:hypothetical protein
MLTVVLWEKDFLHASILTVFTIKHERILFLVDTQLTFMWLVAACFCYSAMCTKYSSGNTSHIQCGGRCTLDGAGMLLMLLASWKKCYTGCIQLDLVHLQYRHSGMQLAQIGGSFFKYNIYI